ncbi:hypothetical protein ACJJTC_005841 [Scirpophaga incertulas]
MWGMFLTFLCTTKRSTESSFTGDISKDLKDSYLLARDFHDSSLQLRSIEEPAAGGAGAGMPAPACYDAECARTEAWLDENQEFVHDYFLRKATRQVVDAWLVSHATPPSAELASPSRAGSGSGATTPVRKISAHEFERGGLLKPLVTTVDGTPTFLGDQPFHATPSRPQRRSRHELRQLDEKELIFELADSWLNKNIKVLYFPPTKLSE